jgi:hypothetical protein
MTQPSDKAMQVAKKISARAAEILWEQGYDDDVETIAILLDEPIAYAIDAAIAEAVQPLVEALTTARRALWGIEESCNYKYKASDDIHTTINTVLAAYSAKMGEK